MIFGPALEPDHHFEDYVNGLCDDDDFLQPKLCTEHPDSDAICERCGFCEDVYYACTEDEEDNL